MGAICRYLMGIVCLGSAAPEGFPLTTFLVNVTGAFLIGVIVATFSKSSGLSPQLLLFLKVGVCGGFTTFSTFSLETFQLIDQGQWALAGFYALSSVVICLAATALGLWIAR